MALHVVPTADTVGPTSTPSYSRWLVLHRGSGLEHATTGRAQYAYGALSLAIEEGFATRVLDAGFAFPCMSNCELVEIIEGPDPAFGRIA